MIISLGVSFNHLILFTCKSLAIIFHREHVELKEITVKLLMISSFRSLTLTVNTCPCSARTDHSNVPGNGLPLVFLHKLSNICNEKKIAESLSLLFENFL